MTSVFAIFENLKKKTNLFRRDFDELSVGKEDFHDSRHKRGNNYRLSVDTVDFSLVSVLIFFYYISFCPYLGGFDVETPRAASNVGVKDNLLSSRS